MIAESRRGFGVLQAALPLAAVVIEFCWLFPWLLFLSGVLYGRAATPLLPAWPAFLMLVLGAVSVRRVMATEWPLSRVRVAVVGVGVAAGLAAVKTTYYPEYAVTDPRWIGVLFTAAHDALPSVLPPVAAAVTAALLWWRGVVLGEREFTYDEVERLFRNGIGWSVFFVVLFAIYHETGAFALAAEGPTYLVAFFSLSLITLAVARLVDLWMQSQADEQQALAMNRHWLLLLLGVVGLILLAAMLISGTLPSDLRPTLARIVSPLGPVVEALFYVIFAVALVIARAIMYVIALFPGRGRILPPPAQADPLGDLLKQLQQWRVHPVVVSGARWGMVLLVVALLCVLIAVAIVRARRRQRKPGEDERESVWSTQALLAGLGSALRSWWRRRRVGASALDTAEMGSVRALYRQLLRWAAAHDVRRRSDQTPYEFRPRLEQLAPAHKDDVDSLTAAYVRARYASDPPSAEDVAGAREALERITGAEDPASRAGRM